LPHRIALALDHVLADIDSESARIENFWESLDEIEPGVVARLAEMAAQRRWEIIFLVSRQSSVGGAMQVQLQRWLESKGFPLPSVYVAPGPRGPIAAALSLDVVIDGSPENCADVAGQSTARAILVWRPEQSVLPDDASRRFDIATSVGECLDKLAVDDRSPHETGWLAWARRLLGSKDASA
jgi:hypothetical protein